MFSNVRAPFMAFVSLFLLAIPFAVFPASLSAQVVERGAPARREIRGIVTDSASGLPLPGTNILVPAGNVSVVTDTSGHFRIIALLPPVVTITARKPGFSPVTRTLDLALGASEQNFALPHINVVLDAVTVSTDTAAQYLASAKPSATMSARDIEQKRGQTIGETIKEMPGVAIIQYGPSIAKPVVRGLHSQRIATVNNGVLQEGQQWGGEHAPEIDGFAANEIEVIRGPGTILYGSSAFGGVVRVTPRPLRVDGPAGGEFTTNAFSNNRQAAGSLLFEGAGLRAPAIGELGWRVQMSGRRAGDASTPDHYLPNTGFKELDYSAAIGVTRDWGRSEINVSHFGTDLALYVGAHVGNLADLERAMANPYVADSASMEIARPFQSVSHDVVAWHTDIALKRGSWLDASYGFQHNVRNEYDNHGFAVGARPAFALELFTHTLDVQYHQAPERRLSGTFGVSGMRQGNLSPGRSFLIPQYRLYSAGIFALETLTLSRVTFTGGARADYRWQHAFQFGAPVVVSPNDVRSYAGISGSFGATYRFANTWSVGSTIARAWRPPNVSERFSSGVHHGTAQYEIGDTSLVAERSLNADATLRQLGARTRFELSVYRNVIDDFIFLEPRAPISTVRGTYPAYGYAHADALLTGLEITGQFNPAPWLELYSNANVVRGTNRETDQPLYDMPADRATVSARVYAGSSARFTSPFVEIGSTLVRTQDHTPSVTIYKLPTDGYALLNLQVGATMVRIGRVRFSPTLAVRNVFSTRYRDYLSRYRLFVDEPGRDIVLRLSVPLGRDR